MEEMGFDIPKGIEDLILEERGFLYLIGEIDTDSARSFVKSLHRALMSGTSREINIFINSVGGTIDDAIMIYDNIRILDTDDKPINTIGTGLIASAAVAVLQAGHDRCVTKNSILMIHEASYSSEGKISDQEDELKSAKLYMRKYIKILKERSVDPVMITDLIKEKKDIYLEATKAKKIGLIDRIL